MTSDDLTAGAAIALGAFLSVALTARVVRSDSMPVVVVEPVTISRAAPRVDPVVDPLVDFAIIRSEAAIMVGPEGPYSGWEPPKTTRSPDR
jgi:hypothetical protein